VIGAIGAGRFNGSPSDSQLARGDAYRLAAGSTIVLRVDGGMTASEFAMQFLADILASPVGRPVVMEATALGAAHLAGLTAGLCPDLDGFTAQWRLDRRFQPCMLAPERKRKYSGWQDAIGAGALMAKA